MEFREGGRRRGALHLGRDLRRKEAWLGGWVIGLLLFFFLFFVYVLLGLDWVGLDCEVW